MANLDELRAKARAHQDELDAAARWRSVGDVAARLRVCDATVRAIPRDELPFIELGTKAKYRRRRYDPADVEAYLDWAKRGKDGPSPASAQRGRRHVA